MLVIYHLLHHILQQMAHYLRIAYIKQLPGQVWTWLTNTVNKVIGWGYNLGSAGARAARQLYNSFVNGIKSLPGEAFRWGADIIDGIVRGIKSCIGRVANAAASVGNKIRSFLHFSWPDEGPLADYETWMPDFMEGLSKGIDKNSYKVKDAIKDLTEGMDIHGLYNELRGTVDIETAKTTASVAANNIVNNYTTSNNSAENGGIPNGSTFILQNSMDSATIGETVYKVVDGKLALQRRRVR